ncbi:MAG: hypothetical protein NZL95_03780 [Chitinophagales bacterium]|nr:hypothetical protein [Chitinophagales bacterium]MDW8427650.1 hypothetical protein [Chitinophagales bacterium]
MNVLLMYIVFACGASDSIPLHLLRARYGAVLQGQEDAHAFLVWLQRYATGRPLELAYVGAAEALVARDAWNPWVKWEYVQRSAQTMKKAIEKEPSNAEIRFLRFSMEHYVPQWLGLSKHLEEDRREIIRALMSGQPANDKILRKNIIQFLLESGRCTPAEQRLLQNLLGKDE